VKARLAVALCLAWIALLSAGILTFGFGWDQGIFATVARSMAHGGVPYRDAWDFKPPGIFFLYALARAAYGANAWGIRVLEVFTMWGMVGAMAVLARRWWGDAKLGLFAAAIAVTIHAQLDFWHTAQPESFGGFLTIIALVPATGEGDSRWIGGGVLFGLAGLLKPQLGACALVVGIWHLPRRRPLALLALGAILPAILCAVWFGAHGALGDLWRAIFVFTPRYTHLGWEKGAIPLAFRAVSDWLVFYSSLVTVGILLLAWFKPAERERRHAALLAGIVGVHLAGVALQAKFHAYHFGATWPPTAMLAALGFKRLWQRIGTGKIGVAAFAAVLLVALLGRTATMADVQGGFWERTWTRAKLLAGGMKDRHEIERLDQAPGTNETAVRMTAAFLDEKTAPGDSIFLWGFDAALYAEADRAPASRYFYDAAQRVPFAAPYRAELVADLRAHPPRAIIVSHGDRVPDIAGGDKRDSAELLDDFPELNDLLRQGYDPAERFGVFFDVYLAKPQTP
jgi:hypothetical protein